MGSGKWIHGTYLYSQKRREASSFALHQILLKPPQALRILRLDNIHLYDVTRCVLCNSVRSLFKNPCRVSRAACFAGRLVMKRDPFQRNSTADAFGT